MSKKITESWDFIHKYLEKHEKESYEILMNKCKGVSEKEILEVEKKFGRKLPNDFKQSLMIHDMKEEILALSTFGYKNSFERILSDYTMYSQGPMITRFAEFEENKNMKIVEGEARGFEGLLPIFTYDEDRTYFYMFLDIFKGAVCYVDYGDLVGDPEGRVVSWSFSQYLESIASFLSDDKTEKFHFRFPSYSFGFHGTEEILNTFPVRRKLILPTSMDMFDLEIPSYQKILKDCYDNPNKHVIAIPKPVVIALGKLSIPKEAEFLSLQWKETKSMNLRNNKKTLRGSYSTQAAGDCILDDSKMFYWEIKIDAIMSVYSLGIVDSGFDCGNSQWKKFTYAFGYTGTDMCANRNVDNCSSSESVQVVGEESRKHFVKNEIVGILLDIENDKIVFYRNRKLVEEVKLSEVLKLSHKKIKEMKFLPFAYFSECELSFVHPGDIKNEGEGGQKRRGEFDEKNEFEKNSKIQKVD